MDFPNILSAEAGVKSNRTGFLSIFDTTVEITQDNLREFYADPAIMKDAIVRLKEAGFTVLSSNKFSIDLIGPTPLFERLFDIEIIITEQGITVAGKEQFGFIDTQDTPFSDVLTGIALSQEATVNGAEPPGKKHDFQRQLDEILPTLNSAGKDVKKLLGKAIENRVTIAVIDTGFDDSHPYFQYNGSIQLGRANFKHFRGTPESVYMTLFSTLKEKEKTLLDLIAKARNIHDSEKTDDDPRQAIDELVAGARKVTTQNQQNKLPTPYQLRDVRTWLEHVEEGTREEIRSYAAYLQGPDQDGHGTGVVSVLLQFVSQMNAIVHVVHTLSEKSAYGQLLPHSIDSAMQSVPDIITSSLSLTIDANMSKAEYEQRSRYIRPYIVKLIAAALEGSVLIFAAGNLSDGKAFEPQLPFILSVGGAFWGQKITDTEDTDTEDRLYASALAQGYQSKIYPDVAVPDVCGLVGPPTEDGNGMHIVPKAGTEDWKYVDGTSYAAPQVAGLCALIKAKYPGVTRDEIREILVRTSRRPVVDGSTTAQGVILNTLEVKLGNETFSPGLVQIESALATAEILHAFQVGGREITVKQAVVYA